ncbi:MAG: adenylyltransferase/cytidyltransferase family protein [Patescibacteria group bacterium]
MKKVMVFGTFDVVHMGHIHMLKEAKEYGDYLVVCVARDKNVELIKGERPYYSEGERVEFLKQIAIVNHVILGQLNDVYRDIGIIKPAVIALGYDQKVFVDELADAITAMNLKIPIVRLKPYRSGKYKSAKLKRYIQKLA